MLLVVLSYLRTSSVLPFLTLARTVLVPRLREMGLLGPVEALHPGVRTYAGDTPHVRYLKLSEGCDHGCAFCAIPLMRGRHRSFALDDVVRVRTGEHGPGAI